MKKTARPEHKIQSALMDYLVLAGRRDLHWFAIPNGEHRHIRAAMRLKAEGVRRGVPDLCFMLPQGRVAWLEMKAPNGFFHQTGIVRSKKECDPVMLVNFSH